MDSSSLTRLLTESVICGYFRTKYSHSGSSAGTSSSISILMMSHRQISFKIKGKLLSSLLLLVPGERMLYILCGGKMWLYSESQSSSSNVNGGAVSN